MLQSVNHTSFTVSAATQTSLDETGLPSLAKPFSVEDARAPVSQLLTSSAADNA